MSRVRTGGRGEGLAHLVKAREFLEVARAALEARWHNAAASNAVTAGINAKDALCFAIAGRSTAADDHRSAVDELRALGSNVREAATALDRLLGLKDRAQYDRRSVTATDAQAAVRRATTLVETAARELGVTLPTASGPLRLPPVLGDPTVNTAEIIAEMRDEERW